ncbi:DNA-directed RNA polymerase specialized sigma24 family protein [Micromonospora sp. Llam0]|uniref:RNA polymerase sigma factor n=1 Tax=Micromonospora sp. Llam0 TaxID=2485143 RepID=UPI000F4728F1|nr:sigma-70 family RNA polymerase sigma factor [Micromonospora sp. Llam0]ROO52749.1 DNA-directed RNA polymerase specialized sigma24 family protein [Micromonospora sp. Llam0]
MAPPISLSVGHDGRIRTTPHAVALLHRAQAGDIDAFAALYDGYRDLLRRYVGVRVRDQHAVDDLVHDTFTDALASLTTADDDVVGWLLRLAGRACTRHSWGMRRYRRAAHELHQAPPATPVTRSDTPRMVLVAALLAAAPLTLAQRQAVELRLAGHPRDVAATEMGRSRDAVRGLERRAIRRIRMVIDVAGAV